MKFQINNYIYLMYMCVCVCIYIYICKSQVTFGKSSTKYYLLFI